MSKSTTDSIRVVFTQGGKGGVGKTEIVVNLATWYRREGVEPKLTPASPNSRPSCATANSPSKV